MDDKQTARAALLKAAFEELNALRQTAERELAKENGAKGDAIRAPAWNQTLIRALAATRNFELFCGATAREGIDVFVMKDAAEFANQSRTM
jgi:hypothetical protein